MANGNKEMDIPCSVVATVSAKVTDSSGKWLATKRPISFSAGLTVHLGNARCKDAVDVWASRHRSRSGLTQVRMYV